MEKKILLLILYLSVLFLVKKTDLMEIQENRGFYIDTIDLQYDPYLESMLCLEPEDTIDQNEITS